MSGTLTGYSVLIGKDLGRINQCLEIPQHWHTHFESMGMIPHMQAPLGVETEHQTDKALSCPIQSELSLDFEAQTYMLFIPNIPKTP